MQFKKIISACALGAMLTTSAMVPTAAQAGATNIIINGVAYECDSSATPQNISNRVYVPLRVISQGLGHDVEWNGENRAVLIDSSASDIDQNASGLQIYIDGEKITTDASTGVPYITPSGYTMVPVRVVAEKLGADVTWNSSDQSVTVTTTGSSNTGSTITKPDVTYPNVTPSVPDNNTGSVDDNQSPSTPSEDGMPQSPDDVTRRGRRFCSLELRQVYLDKLQTTMQQRAAANGTTFVPFPENIAYQYYTIGQKYNIRGDVALAQALLETGYFQYGNEVKPWQNNYCGLGAVGHTTTEEEYANSLLTNIDHSRAWLQVGIHGWIYDSVATGVEAHIQHLYSYATTASLPSGCTLVDGRFNHGNRGVASVITDLNGKWAVPGNGYGENIYNNMLVVMMNS